ncbi:sensor histidine kinase [Chryseolinea lacunae]|uniref:histidine kinase n=1 Tax=Chryseolinea lacunae TaxID=2801331 RepID=A0ABS1KS45_9BACT|nr:hypothetical protein [Chryseolinea lacunae]MBL0741502.1 hypothetical protein [Chryseolinea lacunae]
MFTSSLLAIMLVLSVIVIFHLLIIRYDAEHEIKKLRSLIESDKDHYRSEVVHELIDKYEAEIQQMGADLHDDLIQKLTVYRLYVDKLELAEDIITVQMITSHMKTDFADIVQSIRKISKRLMPEAEVGSFGGMLKELCERVEVPGVAFVKFASSGKENSVNQLHRQHLIRIVQELVTNITKHTVAWHIDVFVEFLAEKIIIRIEDDGRAFDNLQTALSQTNALFFSLRMRLSTIGATLNFKAGSHGTIATLEYPLLNIRDVVFK